MADDDHHLVNGVLVPRAAPALRDDFLGREASGVVRGSVRWALGIAGLGYVFALVLATFSGQVLFSNWNLSFLQIATASDIFISAASLFVNMIFTTILILGPLLFVTLVIRLTPNQFREGSFTEAGVWVFTTSVALILAVAAFIAWISQLPYKDDEEGRAEATELGLSTIRVSYDSLSLEISFPLIFVVLMTGVILVSYRAGKISDYVTFVALGGGYLAATLFLLVFWVWDTTTHYANKGLNPHLTAYFEENPLCGDPQNVVMWTGSDAVVVRCNRGSQDGETSVYSVVRGPENLIFRTRVDPSNMGAIDGTSASVKELMPLLEESANQPNRQKQGEEETSSIR